MKGTPEERPIAGLMLRTVAALTRANPGFDASRFDLTSRAPNKVQKSFVMRFNAIERAR